MTHRVPSVAALLAVAVLGTAGCDQTSEDTIPEFVASRTGDLVTCGEGSFDRVQINALLADYPELAEELGISEVQTCDDASTYFEAYADYIESFPSEEAEAGDDDLPADFRIAAADGTNLSTNGVLELPGGCTGVLIHSRALLTAAQCVDQWAPSGEKNFDKSNFTIKNFGGGSWTGTVRINIHPNFTGNHVTADSGDDIAVIKRYSGSFGFPNSHRHRLYTGKMSTIGWMKAFGRGFVNNSTGFGTLRYMNFKPNWSGPYHFLMDANDPSRVCSGDQGGPVRDFTPTHGYPVVAGLLGSFENYWGQTCAIGGGKQRAVRIQRKVRWIDDMLGGNDHDSCTAFTDSGWTYERCW